MRKMEQAMPLPIKSYRPFTKATARAEHKAKAKQFVDGRWWYAPRIAARYVGASHATLFYRWQVSCPWLDGQGIETRLLPSGYGRIITYYAKDDLDRVRAARAHRAPVPIVPGYVYIEDAMVELGWSMRTLRRWMDAKKVRPKKISAKEAGRPARAGPHVRALRRSYVPRTFVDECKAAQTAKPPGKITYEEAAAILGITYGGVNSLVVQRILKPYPGRVPCKRGYLRKHMLLSRADVERRKAQQNVRRSLDARQKAADVLTKILADGPRWRSEAVAEARRRGLGYSMVYRVASQLGVRRIKSRGLRGFPGPWQWALPNGNGQNGATHHGPPTGIPAIPAAEQIPQRKGRHRSKDTAEVYEFCYVELRTQKRRAVWKAAEAKYGDSAPTLERDVTTFARRHAKRHDLPWPVK
jgi:hypothetical protein